MCGGSDLNRIHSFNHWQATKHATGIKDAARIKNCSQTTYSPPCDWRPDGNCSLAKYCWPKLSFIGKDTSKTKNERWKGENFPWSFASEQDCVAIHQHQIPKLKCTQTNTFCPSINSRNLQQCFHMVVAKESKSRQTGGQIHDPDTASWTEENEDAQTTEGINFWDNPRYLHPTEVKKSIYIYWHLLRIATAKPLLSQMILAHTKISETTHNIFIQMMSKEALH